ncbi:MAG: hypothetical protein IT581_15665 [Verrucomicrobiales bacterium]|nr:hypothetical protein [Verrucomicrobiales bacterium]
MIPTTDTIRRASEILSQIDSLQTELVGLFGGGGTPAAKRRGRPRKSSKAITVAAAVAPVKRRRKMSAEGRARIAAAAKARWAKFRSEKKSG